MLMRAYSVGLAVRAMVLALGVGAGALGLGACGSGDSSGLTGNGGSGNGGSGSGSGASGGAGDGGSGGTAEGGSAGLGASGGTSGGLGGSDDGGASFGGDGGSGGDAGSSGQGGSAGGGGEAGSAGDGGQGGSAGNGAGNIGCGPEVCGLNQGQFCCQPQMAAPHCVTASNQCVCTGILCSKVEVRCDGTEDCPGKICCYEKGVASEANVSCAEGCQKGITTDRAEVCKLGVDGSCTQGGSCKQQPGLPQGYGTCR